MPHRFLCFFVAALLGGCGSSAPPYQPVTDVAQLMAWILEPAADVIWDSSGEVHTLEGIESLAPATEDEWNHLRNQAALVAEVGNLLLMPHFAMERPQWSAISARLTSVGDEARAAADARDADAVFAAGAQLYQVCVSCHGLYWPQANSFSTTP